MLKTLTSRFGHRGRQVTATPSVVFALPGRRQPPDHRRREVRRVLAEQARERLLEVASRDAPQVEDGQERIEALRPTRPARQDHGREPDLLRLGHVGSVAHLGPLHLQGADPGLDPPHRPVPVSDDPLAPVRKCDAGMLRHEGVRLHPHGYGQHPPRSLARDLRQWIIDRIDLAEWDNGSSLLHGVSLLQEVLAVFATATIRRLLTPPSPISPHSSLAFKGSGIRTYAILPMTVFMSSAEKARSVSVRMLPCPPMLNASAVAAISSVASLIVTMS